MSDPTPAWKMLLQSAQRARLGTDHEQAIALYTQALAQADIPWEAYTTMMLERANSRQMLVRQAGVRVLEGWFLNLLYISTPDLAQAGSLLEQALEVLESVGDQACQGYILCNQSGLLVQSGLYQAGLEVAQREGDRRFHRHPAASHVHLRGRHRQPGCSPGSLHQSRQAADSDRRPHSPIAEHNDPGHRPRTGPNKGQDSRGYHLFDSHGA
jgi:tetratricopeptide (TPR) repeat protein